MHHLTHSQRDRLRAQLAERAAVLRGEIAQALHETAAPAELGLPGRRVEAGDEAVADLEASIELSGVERDADELNAVVAALARIDGNRYGLCGECGAPIAYERLLAQPQAPRCIRCETERERMRARPSLPAL